MPVSSLADWRQCPAAFASPAENVSAPPLHPLSLTAEESPPRLLWGRDPYLLSSLLTAIGSEAANRRKNIFAVYDPYLPTRLTALTAEGVGSFTLSPRQLTVEGGLIDCTLPLPECNGEALVRVRDLAEAKCALAKEIVSVGRVLADAHSLLAAQGSRLVDRPALRAKAERLAKKFPRGEGSIRMLAIQSYGEEGTVIRLPFGNEVRVMGLPAHYSLASLFLADFSDTLTARGCDQVVLTAAFTGTVLGIWLPDCGICYLTDAPVEEREKEITLSRFLHPFTAKERRSYRRLSSSAEAVVGHLCHRLAEYRALAKEEREILATLHSESRLQNFRKRLLIDLFCS